MASPGPELARRQKKHQLRDSDWEPWKDLVYTKYIVNDMELNDVVAELDRGGLVVKYVVDPLSMFRLLCY
jgi:hypothetical protein